MRWLVCSLGVSVVLAGTVCRYTVRDVAFVDLGGDGWTLRAEVPASMSREWPATLKRIAMASFADTNVALVVAAGPPDGALAVTLISPDGRTLAIELPADVEALKRHGWDELDRLASSPVRDRYRDRCLAAHAVVLVFEGEDGADNGRARRLAGEAVEQSRSILAGLPKPARAPAEVCVIPFSERARERVLHWAVGADDEDPADAHVAVLYGRGRRMGPVLGGPAITASAIKHALVLIGQDCECELPRSIMRGGQIPLAWDEDQAGRAQRILGFDGRNPMIKQEIARIVARESAAPNAPRAVGVDPLGLGYHEQALEAPLDEPSTTADAADTEPGPSPRKMASAVKWILVAGLALLVLVGAGVAAVVLSARSGG